MKRQKQGRKRAAAAVRRRRSGQSDPADLALFGHMFSGIAEEMGAALIRSAHSPNIKERRDCSCALFDNAGRLVAQAAHIPVHLGAMPMSVDAVRARCGTLQPGDAVVLNDPFSGGTHLPDLTLVTPVFIGNRKKEPVMYLASRAHHADVGGATPGSLPASTEIYQEGLRLPPVYLRRNDEINSGLLDVILANSRTPHERAADLRAQLAAHDLGAVRVGELFKRYSPAVLGRHIDALFNYARRLMQSIIARLPDGTYVFEDVLDDDAAGQRDVRIKVSVSIRNKSVRVDFSGSASCCGGNLNATESITRSAVYYCFLCLLVTEARQRHGGLEPPINAGCFAPLEVIAPSGTVVCATPPHAVACGNLETAQRLVDVVFGALAQCCPQWVPAAGQGTMNNLTLGGVEPDSNVPFAYYETIGGGMGATPYGAGLDAVQVHMTNTLNTPAEALEFSYPLRIICYQMIPGSGGSGAHRGGYGVRRDVATLCDARGTLMTDRRVHPPYGLQGGKPGRRGRNVLIRAGRQMTLPAKTTLELQAGDIISVRTPGGGGWGKQ